MGTLITTLIEGTKHILAGSVRYRENSFEHCLTYQRADGLEGNIVLSHLPRISGEGYHEPLFTLALIKRRKQAEPIIRQCCSVSLEEARLLRDFLNREEVKAWLEEEERD